MGRVRSGGQRDLREGIAARAGHAQLHDPVHDGEASTAIGRKEVLNAGHTLKLFGHVLAQAPQCTIAMGTVLVAGNQLDLLARNVIWDRSALWLVLRFFIGQPQLRCHLDNGDLAGFQGQLQLLDALRRGAEPMAAVMRLVSPSVRETMADASW